MREPFDRDKINAENRAMHEKAGIILAIMMEEGFGSFKFKNICKSISAINNNGSRSIKNYVLVVIGFEVVVYHNSYEVDMELLEFLREQAEKNGFKFSLVFQGKGERIDDKTEPCLIFKFLTEPEYNFD